MDQTTQQIFSYDLFVSPEDILDTWGPGHLITDITNPMRVYAVSVAGGNIQATRSGDQITYHWSRGWSPSEVPMISFDRSLKKPIGASIRSNLECGSIKKLPEWQSSIIPHVLGTFPSVWEVSELQLALQGGLYAIVQANKVWTKAPGRTKKDQLLSPEEFTIADFEGSYAVQVSYCTGIARRAPLRELLADILPAYINELVQPQPLWEKFSTQILDALRGPDLKDWLQSLGTGIDRSGEHFVIATIHEEYGLQALKVRCERESYWAKILADSEDIATFAYIVPKCFVTDSILCTAPTAWKNSTTLFETAVCRSHYSMPPKLGEAKAYLIGKPDSPLLARIDKSPDLLEPRLLVKNSIIPPSVLWRLYEKKEMRLRERLSANQAAAEAILILTDSSGSKGVIKGLKERIKPSMKNLSDSPLRV
ncbi:hypothetical protein FQN57_000341 [Myotisia sp. PD_48]|nr:hypothetical protein FQN57_000341 [Myotisia sp. PD_48]